MWELRATDIYKYYGCSLLYLFFISFIVNAEHTTPSRSNRVVAVTRIHIPHYMCCDQMDDCGVESVIDFGVYCAMGRVARSIASIPYVDVCLGCNNCHLKHPRGNK